MLRDNKYINKSMIMISDEGRAKAASGRAVREGLGKGLTVEVTRKAFQGQPGGAVG